MQQFSKKRDFVFFYLKKVCMKYFLKLSKISKNERNSIIYSKCWSNRGKIILKYTFRSCLIFLLIFSAGDFAHWTGFLRRVSFVSNTGFKGFGKEENSRNSQDWSKSANKLGVNKFCRLFRKNRLLDTILLLQSSHSTVPA